MSAESIQRSISEVYEDGENQFDILKKDAFGEIKTTYYDDYDNGYRRLLEVLDFICIYGKKCKVLDKNLHGDNEFGFAEFINKREKITEAIKLSIKDDYVIVGKSDEGLVYSLNERGGGIVTNIQSSYSKAYAIGARIVCRKFANYTDEAVLKYISKLATESKEV